VLLYIVITEKGCPDVKVRGEVAMSNVMTTAYDHKSRFTPEHAKSIKNNKIMSNHAKVMMSKTKAKCCEISKIIVGCHPNSVIEIHKSWLFGTRMAGGE
jgi:hypothetical protein